MTPSYYDGPLRSIFADNVPLIDVRSPVEFKKGAFPAAVNLPILDDRQRHEVGICYKEHGREEAIALGHRLVSGQDRASKIGKWINAINANPNSLLYCFRGGLRSQIARSWLEEEGISIPIIEGGYKRLRNYLLENIDEEISRNRFLVISGSTGSGKTELLKRLSDSGHRAIDLEGLANHRGSAFGRYLTPQPTQINFENNVSIQLIKESQKGASPILLEDESATIGQVYLPLALYEKKKQSPTFVLRIPLKERTDFILDDYVKSSWPGFEDLDESHLKFFDFFKSPFDRIRKKFGETLYHECLSDLKAAIDDQEKSGSFSLHKVWIEKLLVHYYDPLYARGLAKKEAVIVGEGDEAALRDFLETQKSD